jgi:hypothetical protein
MSFHNIGVDAKKPLAGQGFFRRPDVCRRHMRLCPLMPPRPPAGGSSVPVEVRP